MAATLFCLAGYQVTGERAGERLLGRIGAALVELDLWLPAHRQDLQLLARDRPNATVQVADLPVRGVTLPSSETQSADDETLKRLLRRSMGESLYDQGTGALRDEDGESHLSITEPVRWSVSLLSAGAHGFWRAALVLTALVLLALCAMLLMLQQSPAAAVLWGALAAAACSLAVWLVARGAASVFDGAIDREIALVVRDGAWLGLRNALAVAAVAASLIFLARVLFGSGDRSWSHAADRGEDGFV
ncbi:MAG TPA: hypothetical protein VNN21_01825 [Dehalococcoidia bacterium]|nr:hypothetical protein [Dehalococcoidia bacterium]